MDRLLRLIARRIRIEPITPIKEIPARVTSGVAKDPCRGCTQDLNPDELTDFQREVFLQLTTLHTFDGAIKMVIETKRDASNLAEWPKNRQSSARREKFPHWNVLGTFLSGFESPC